MSTVRVILSVALIGTALLGGFCGCSKSDGQSIERPDVSQLPPTEQVFELAATGKLDQLKSLIAADPALISARGNYDWTPLHYAAAYGQNAVVKYLLSNGADPKAVDENSYEPAAIAAQRQHTDTAKIIRDAAMKSAGQ